MITRKCAINGGLNWVSWTQPVLSADGTLGGANFACATNNGNYTWKMFDNNNDTDYISTSKPNNPYVQITFYNPLPLKVSSIVIRNGGSVSNAITAGSIQGSNDGTNWTTITTFTNATVTKDTNWTIPVNSTVGYKYHKIQATGVHNNISLLYIATTTITATYQA